MHRRIMVFYMDGKSTRFHERKFRFCDAIFTEGWADRWNSDLHRTLFPGCSVLSPILGCLFFVGKNPEPRLDNSQQSRWDCN